MSFPFLTDDEQHELDQRILRAREEEDKRHGIKKGRITQDAVDRGLSGSTIHTGGIASEEVNHLRQLARISREELFAIIEGKNIHLRDRDVDAIRQYIENPFLAESLLAREWFAAWEKDRGVTSMLRLFDRLVEQSLSLELAEVAIRTGELHRKRLAERKKWWSERVEKFVWIVVGLLVGVLGTLLVQYVTRRLS